MKTTIELADAILAQAKAVAAREGVTLRALVEEALRASLQDRERPPFRLRDGSVDGEGIAAEFQDHAALHAAIYEGRGG